MTDVPMPYLQGSGESRLAFEDIDQDYHLKVRAFVGLCMPPVFTNLSRHFDLKSLREEGTVPIMYFLQFERDPQTLTFGGKVSMEHRVTLRRQVLPGPPGASAGGVERLMLDMRIEVLGEEGSGDPGSLGSGPRPGRLVPAGRMRGVHVITRPVAPPGERQVVQVPPQLRGLQEQPWDEPAPSVELLSELPPGYGERAAGPWQEQRSVWALHNTDINQHVNVQEYITGMENHFARMLFGANLPLPRHRIERMTILFRKPFFKGEAHAVRGRLFTTDQHTLLVGGIHRVEPEGGIDARPAVFARLEGRFDPAG